MPERFWVPALTVSETEGAAGAKGRSVPRVFEEWQGSQCAWNWARERENGSQGGQRN